MENTPIIFNDWEQVLNAEVSQERRCFYREAIKEFRYWLRETGNTPVDETFKAHLEWKKSYLPPERFAVPLVLVLSVP